MVHPAGTLGSRMISTWTRRLLTLLCRPRIHKSSKPVRVSYACSTAHLRKHSRLLQSSVHALRLCCEHGIPLPHWEAMNHLLQFFPPCTTLPTQHSRRLKQHSEATLYQKTQNTISFHFISKEMHRSWRTYYLFLFDSLRLYPESSKDRSILVDSDGCGLLSFCTR